MQFTWNMLTGLSRPDHKYDRIVGSPALRKSFIEFVKSHTTIPPPAFGTLAANTDAKFLAVAKNFNRRAVNQEGGEVANEVSDGDSSALRKRLAGKETVSIANKALSS